MAQVHAIRSEAEVVRSSGSGLLPPVAWTGQHRKASMLTAHWQRADAGIPRTRRQNLHLQEDRRPIGAALRSSHWTTGGTLGKTNRNYRASQVLPLR